MLVRFGTRLARLGQEQPDVSRETSQEVMPVAAQMLPYSETYKLYPVEGTTRAASVSAVVPYEIYGE
jgi:hypothetical protein